MIKGFSFFLKFKITFFGKVKFTYLHAGGEDSKPRSFCLFVKRLDHDTSEVLLTSLSNIETLSS